MRQPTDIAIAPDGMKYVVDRRVGRIFVFDAEDRHVSTLGQRGLIPVGVAVRGDELFVPDFETQSVLVLDRQTGNTLRSIGEAGGGPGQFIRPLGVDVDQDGNIYVTDAIRGRLQKFAPDGELIFIQTRPATSFVRSTWPWTAAASSTSWTPPFRTFRCSTPTASC
jgi:tripartite motif-containing protein 71